MKITAKWLGSAYLLCVLLATVMPGYAAEGEKGADLTELDIESLMELDAQHVYGASKYSQKLSEAPSAVTIITSEDIRLFGYRTVADALRGVRGFHITNDRNYRYAGVRGFGRLGDYNSRMLVLIDGNRLNNGIDGNAPIGNDFPIDMDLIDRIEVIPGPGSSLYGSNAFFAVINVITKYDFDLRGAQVSGEAGSGRSFRGRVSGGLANDEGLGALVSATGFDSKGRSIYFREFDTPSTNGGWARNLDGERGRSFFGKVRYDDFTLLAAVSRRTKEIPTAPYETAFNDPRAKTRDTHGLLDLRFERDLGSNINLTARLYSNYWEFRGDYPEEGAPVVLNRDTFTSAGFGTEIKAVGQFIKGHRLTLGLDYRADLKRRMINEDVDPPAPEARLLKREDSRTTGIYLQDEITIIPSVIVSAGLRYDGSDCGHDMLSPRLAAIWSITPRTVLKAIYGRAFRSPNFYERMYGDGGATSKPNPRLNPETIQNYELVLEHLFLHAVRMQVSAFHYRIKNLITQQTDPADNLILYRNTGRVRAGGIEAEIEKRWASGAMGRFSYSYQKVESLDTAGDFPNSPKHLAKLHAVYPLLRKEVFGAMELLYIGTRATLSGGSAGDYLTANATLYGAKIWKSLDASMSVYNIFNRKYSDPAGVEHRMDVIPQEGRSFRIKLTYTF